jgi:hypothetical protein
MLPRSAASPPGNESFLFLFSFFLHSPPASPRRRPTRRRWERRRAPRWARPKSPARPPPTASSPPEEASGKCVSYIFFLIVILGFSTYVKRPDWQDQAVHNYLNGPNQVCYFLFIFMCVLIVFRFLRAPCSRRRDARTPTLPPWDTTTVSNSLYFSTFSHFFPARSSAITVGGQVYVGSGTSASTPVVAGMFTLINVRLVVVVCICLNFFFAGTAVARWQDARGLAESHVSIRIVH